MDSTMCLVNHSGGKACSWPPCTPAEEISQETDKMAAVPQKTSVITSGTEGIDKGQWLYLTSPWGGEWGGMVTWGRSSSSAGVPVSGGFSGLEHVAPGSLAMSVWDSMVIGKMMKSKEPELLVCKAGIHNLGICTILPGSI